MKNIIEGLQILIKYYENEDSSCRAEHDIIYAGPELDEDSLEKYLDDYEKESYKDINMSKEDFEKMKMLNWFIDSDIKCWAYFC